MICIAWACKHTYIAESFVGLCTHSSVWKVSSAHRGECVTTGGLYRPTHLCVAHFELHKKSSVFLLWCGKVGGVFGEGGRGGGGGSMFQEVRVCMGFQRGAGWFEFRALTAWGKKLLSSLAERALMLRYHLPDGRSWKRLWVGSFTMLLVLLEHHARKMSRMDGRGARWSLQPCSLSAGGSCGQQHCSSRTRQWCSWSAHSQWCPCRMWWGWVVGDLLFSAGGESVGAVVPSWRVTWCWSRWDPLWCAPPGI